jgi:predicted PurR-regulated permease PerM
MENRIKSVGEQARALGGTRLLMAIASIVIIIWGVNQAQSVLALVLVAVFLAILAASPVVWLKEKGFPGALAVLIVVAAMVVALLLIGVVVGTSVSGFSDSLPLYQSRIREHLLTIKTMLAGLGITVTDKALLQYANPGTIMTLTTSLVSGLGSVVSNVVLILLTVTFILIEASSFPAKLRAILADPQRTFAQYSRFVEDIKSYTIIKTLISLAAGVLVGIWLYILGVDFPILWGFLAFLLHYVPNVGFLFAAVPAVLYALVQLGVGAAALTASGYVVISFILGNIVEPRFMGRRLGLSTLVVFLSLVFWGSVLGPVGLILCVPLTMTLKFACESSESTHWLYVLLTPENSREPAPREPQTGSVVGAEAPSQPA